MKKIVNYFFELGMLKRIFHNGPQAAGVKEPDTVASHVYRAAVIGYILGEMEGVKGEKVASIVLFHDNPEARIGDHNKIAQRYIKRAEVEQEVLDDQTKLLPKSIGKKINKYWNDMEYGKTKEGIIAKDADHLETALQAKEYADIGYPTKTWVANVKKALKTKSAKKLLTELENTKFTDWWKNLKKIS